MKRLWRLFPVVVLVALGAGNGFAESYPSRPVRFVVPMAAGGQMDTIARLIAQKLTEAWKQPVLIENRGGSGGNVGANSVAKAEPDGYTFLIAASGIAISPSIYRKLPFDALNDFVPVSLIYSSFLILVVNTKVPAVSVKELIALAKTQPGFLNYGSTGMGGNSHLAAELFKSLTGTEIVHIPYKGVAHMNTAVLANDVQLAFTTQEGILPSIKSGKLRTLAITGKARSSVLVKVLEVPTMVEAGVLDFELPNWVGLFAPAGTSHEIVAKLHAEIVRILAMPEIRERILNIGEPGGNTPEEFAAMYKADLARYARIVAKARVPLQD